MMKRGDILEFKRKGFVSKVLGDLLGFFERDWDKFGWHLAIAWDKAYGGWYILEATALGQKINYYSDEHLAENSRSWNWLDKTPGTKQMGKFLESHIDKSYDVGIYFWTTFAIIFRHYFNHPIPKLLDNRFSCWELVQSFAEDMGKPIISKYDVVIISDMIRAFKGKKK